MKHVSSRIGSMVLTYDTLLSFKWFWIWSPVRLLCRFVCSQIQPFTSTHINILAVWRIPKTSSDCCNGEAAGYERSGQLSMAL